MRTHENDIRTTLTSLGNVAGTAPGVTWTASNGTYDFRLSEPRAKLLGVSPAPAPGGGQFTLNSWSLGATPPTAQVQFLSTAGAAGGFGGAVLVHWKRGTA